MPPRASVSLTPSLLTNVPPKNPTTAKVLYKAVFYAALVSRCMLKEGSYHVVHKCRISLAPSTHSVQSIKHTRAHKTYKSHHSQLNLGRSIPRQHISKEPILTILVPRWYINSPSGVIKQQVPISVGNCLRVVHRSRLAGCGCVERHDVGIDLAGI